MGERLLWAVATFALLLVVLYGESRILTRSLAARLNRLRAGSGRSRRLLGASAFGRLVEVLFLVPSTFLHEGCHWLACKLTLVEVAEFVPYSPQRDGTIGWVRYRGAGVLRSQVIGLAPFAVGLALLFLLGRALGTDLDTAAGPAGLAEMRPAEALGAWAAVSAQVLAGQDYASWTTWLLLYAALTVGLGMVPSWSDLRHLLGTLVVLSGLALSSYLVFLFFGLPASVQEVLTPLFSASLGLLVRLNSLLLLAAATLAVALALALATLAVATVLGALLPSPLARRRLY